MKLTINGQEVDGVASNTVTDLLVEQKVKTPVYVSVELNGEILDRNQLDSATLKDGDRVEFLYFMGGGQWN
ncbi:MAG: sulfur carrier protein ThiS [Candidatus Hydrogenedentes bacterium]|nr:sulfur carrier protein ThiS [Candidatus Hydrogenedentota bacterium]